MHSFSSSAQIAQVHEASRPGAVIGMDPSWWGLGGLHGGLALSMLTAAMRDRAQGRILQQVSGRFRRVVRAPFSLQVQEPTIGKIVSWVDADAIEDGRVAVSANAVFAAPVQDGAQAVARPMPVSPAPADCPIFTIPSEFVPFASHTEIRPVGRARPFSGAAEPELTAWLRLVDDDLPPDEARLVVLMDALAPSYAAILHKQLPIPTVTFTVTPSSGLAQATSPWVLVRARTDACRPDGWLLERLDAWTPEGVHIGSAEQLRAVMTRT